MSSRLVLAIFLAVMTCLRWWSNLARPLSAEEAYLALCGFSPSAAYFDGPGGTPLLVALGISLGGAGGFGATFFWPVLAAISSLVIYSLVSSLAGRREGLAIAVLLNILPLFNHASLHASCAMPLATATLGSLLCAWMALDKRSPAWWFAAGLCAALALLFSYTAWFLVPSVTLVLLASHRWRSRLLSAGFWTVWIPPAAACIALVQWNARHAWVHYIGGTWRTALDLRWSGLWTSLLGAAQAVTPFVLVALVLAAFVAVARVRTSPKLKFVSLPALAAVLAALYAALRGLAAMSPGLLAAALALPLLAWLPQHVLRFPTRTITAILFLSAASWTAFTLQRRDDRGFIDSDVGQIIGGICAEQSHPGAPPLFLIAENAPIAAALAFALPESIPAIPGHPRVYTVESAAASSQFDLWPRYDQFVATSSPAIAAEDPDPFTEQDGTNPFIGRSALYIATQGIGELPQAITAAFTSVKAISQITAADGRILQVYLCSDYQTMPL